MTSVAAKQTQHHRTKERLFCHLVKLERKNNSEFKSECDSGTGKGEVWKQKYNRSKKPAVKIPRDVYAIVTLVEHLARPTGDTQNEVIKEHQVFQHVYDY